MKKNDTLAEELAALRTEVENLRHQQTASKKTSSNTPKKPKKKNHADYDLEKEAHDLFASILENAKNDYDNLSPASALLLFALGAVFGSILSRHGGGQS